VNRPIFLICIDSKSTHSFFQIKLGLEKRLKRPVIFINKEKHPPGDGYWLLEGLKESILNSPSELFDNAQYIRVKYGLEPSTYYKSDLRYGNGRASEEELCQEARFLLNRVSDLLEKYKPEYVFLPGGGNQYGNLIFKIAELKGIKTFRIYPFHWINLEKKSRRYFISDNLFHDLTIPDSEIDQETLLDAKNKAREYYDAIFSKSYAPDSKAREVAGKNRFTPSFIGFLKDTFLYFAKGLRNLISREDNKKKSSIHKLRIQSYLSKSYTNCLKPKISKDDKYFVYILHQPTDSQLNFRGFPFLDQIATCRMIMANLPAGTKLYIKEHPVHPGMISLRDIRLLNKEYKSQCEYLNYSFRLNDIIKSACGVISINSTAGLEAMILGKPVIILGEGIYKNTRSAYRIEKIYDIKRVLTDVSIEKKTPTKEDVTDILTRALCHCTPDPSVEGGDFITYITEGIVRKVKEA
jgi:capsular polysaccharide biosynthesis protein